MKPRHSILLTGCIALSLGSSSANADPSQLVPQVGYDYGEIENGRTMALGGAMRAFGNGTAAVYGNPAALTLTRVYHMGVHAAFWPEPGRQTYGATVVDSMTNRIAGGVGANYAVLDPDRLDRKWTDVRLAFAFPLTEKFSVGLAGRYFKLREGGASLYSMPASYASAGRAGEPIVDNLTFDAGVIVRPIEALAIGIVGANLTNPGNSFLPTSLGGGIGYGTPDFTVEGNLVADFTSYLSTDATTRITFRGMGGFEYLAGDHFPLRIGYRYDSGLATHSLSGGLGYVDPQFSIEIGARRSVAGPDYATPMTAVVVDIQYFLESSSIAHTGGEAE